MIRLLRQVHLNRHIDLNGIRRDPAIQGKQLHPPFRRSPEGVSKSRMRRVVRQEPAYFAHLYDKHDICFKTVRDALRQFMDMFYSPLRRRIGKHSGSVFLQSNAFHLKKYFPGSVLDEKIKTGIAVFHFAPDYGSG